MDRKSAYDADDDASHPYPSTSGSKGGGGGYHNEKDQYTAYTHDDEYDPTNVGVPRKREALDAETEHAYHAPSNIGRQRDYSDDDINQHPNDPSTSDSPEEPLVRGVTQKRTRFQAMGMSHLTTRGRVIYISVQ